jgi:hypothetical protein
MSFRHLRRRLGTKLAAFVLIAVAVARNIPQQRIPVTRSYQAIDPTLRTLIWPPQELKVGMATEGITTGVSGLVAGIAMRGVATGARRPLPPGSL